MTRAFLLTILISFILFLCSCAPIDAGDKNAPVLISSTPAHQSLDVDTNSSVSFFFTEKVLLANHPMITVNTVLASASVYARTLTVEIDLQPNTTYTVTIPDQTIKDVAGNYATAISINFTTAESDTNQIIDTVDEYLVTPNPSEQAVNLYQFLKENYGLRVISGAMANHSTNIDEAVWIHEQTGKWPVLTTFDFIDHTNPDQNWIKYNAPYDLGLDWWNNNGLVGLMWHWRDPLTKSGAFYTSNTTFDVSRISNPDSDEYKAMIHDIDVIAGYLKQFKDAGIPVIWRPLHEASGRWFWWGAKGAAPCVTLWRTMFERLVNHHGLNNLIWVWTTDATADAVNWYPGDDYVDILGMDIYPGENQHGSQYVAFNKVREMFGGKKMIALSECGSVPDPALMKEKGDMWSWFMPWNGDLNRSDLHNGADWWNKYFSYNYVISRDMMPSLK